MTVTRTLFSRRPGSPRCYDSSTRPHGLLQLPVLPRQAFGMGAASAVLFVFGFRARPRVQHLGKSSSHDFRLSRGHRVSSLTNEIAPSTTQPLVRIYKR